MILHIFKNKLRKKHYSPELVGVAACMALVDELVTSTSAGVEGPANSRQTTKVIDMLLPIVLCY